MAYITKDEVKEKRDNVKKLFPSSLGWKFSITNDNSSSINVAILRSPIELRNLDKTSSGNFTVTANSTLLTNVGREVVEKIYEIINVGNYNNSNNMIDYFDVGYYSFVNIGKWNKPFEVNNIEITPKLQKAIKIAA